MSEVEKLYKNAGVKKYRLLDRDNKLKWKYPDFTAEKQLEIVKFMLHKGIYYDTDGDSYWFHLTDDIENANYKPLDRAMAEFINLIWQDLTEKEQEQIADILKG